MSASVPTETHPARRRIELAWEATLALTSALELIPGVNVAITAFPGQQGLDERVYEVMGHGERLAECTDRFEIGTDGSTPLTEALIYGISHLLMTREPRKMLLVLTDGIPNDPMEAEKVLKQCAEIGIEVHGIGLGIDIQHLFESSINIQDLKELQARLFKWSEALLTIH
jgi:Mg-chelatase subunit ChlD